MSTETMTQKIVEYFKTHLVLFCFYFPNVTFLFGQIAEHYQIFTH